jgi:hypothetical protein
MNRKFEDRFQAWERRQREIDATLRREIRGALWRDTLNGLGAVLTLCLVLACVIALFAGCGDQAPEEPEPGWCCGDTCGLWGDEADTAGVYCTCEGYIHRAEGTRLGECDTEPAYAGQLGGREP